MNAADLNINARDMRRAAALLAHAAAGDVQGMRAVWEEVAADGERGWADLTAAVVALLFDLAPDLKSDGGVEVLRLLARDWAAWEQRGE